MSVRAALLAAALALAGCVAQSPYIPPPLTGEPTPLAPPEDAWARVLAAAVDAQGRVDFNALVAVHADLDRYVAWIYERSPERWPEIYRTRAQAVAFHVNAYNALALYLLLQTGVPPQVDRAAFDKRKLLVGGQPVTLAAYRVQVLGLGDPRLAFAITRHAMSDPPLAREPYRAATLDAQLARAERAFHADPRGLRLDAADFDWTLRHAGTLPRLQPQRR